MVFLSFQLNFQTTTLLDKFKCHFVKSVQIRSFVWSVFSRIQIEYGDLLRKFPYSVRIRENTDQKKLRLWILFTQRLHPSKNCDRSGKWPGLTVRKMKCSIRDFFSKCDQIRRKLRIWSQLLKNP